MMTAAAQPSSPAPRSPGSVAIPGGGRYHGSTRGSCPEGKRKRGTGAGDTARRHPKCAKKSGPRHLGGVAWRARVPCCRRRVTHALTNPRSKRAMRSEVTASMSGHPHPLAPAGHPLAPRALPRCRPPLLMVVVSVKRRMMCLQCPRAREEVGVHLLLLEKEVIIFPCGL